MENNNKNYSVSLVSWPAVVLFIVFFIAKIYNKIDWSWWWVFSPLWIPTILCLIILFIIGLIYLWK